MLPFSPSPTPCCCRGRWWLLLLLPSLLLPSLLLPSLLLPVWAVHAAAQQPDVPVEKEKEKVEAPAKPEPISPPARVVAPKAPRARSHRTPRGDLVVIGNDVVVKENETAQQVVVIGGSLTLEGKVTGDALVILGGARLGPKAEVRNCLIVVGGGLEADPAARVGDTRFVLGGGGGVHNAAWLRWPAQWMNGGLMYARPLPPQYWWSWASVALALLLYVGVALLFPRPIQSAITLLEQRPVNAWLTGLLAFMILTPLLVLLAITVVGLLAIPFVAFAFLAAFVFGKVAVYRFAGQQAGAQLGVTWLQQPLLALLVGALFFCLLYTVPVLGAVIWLAVAPLGLGAVMLALFGRPRPAAGRVVGGVPPSSAPAAAFAAAAAAPFAGPATGAETPVMLPRAGFWLRFVASLLDLLIVGLVVSMVFHRPRWFLFTWVVYHLAFWTWYGTTIGGTILRLQLIRLEGRPMNFAVAFVRLLGAFFSAAALGLGFLWAGWSSSKQSWHDKMAGTVVVKLPKPVAQV